MTDLKEADISKAITQAIRDALVGEDRIIIIERLVINYCYGGGARLTVECERKHNG